jgi:hemolysin activation/secretion protein
MPICNPLKVGHLIPAVFIGSALVFSAASESFAQGPAASQLTPQTLRPAAAPPAGVITVPEAAPQQIPAGAEALQVLIRHVELDGEFPELAEEVRVLSESIRGLRVTVAQLFAYAAAVEQAYARAGYVLVRVVVPAQELVDGGVFRLVLIDGYIEAVDASRLPERVRPQRAAD